MATTIQVLKYCLRKVSLVSALMLSSAHSMGAESERPQHDLILECEPLKADFCKDEAYLIRCDFKNITNHNIILDTGFFGIQYLRFEKTGTPRPADRGYPSGGGLDNALHSYSMAPGATISTILALNGWLVLPIGTSKVDVLFKSPKYTAQTIVVVTFHRGNDAELRRALRGDVAFAKKPKNWRLRDWPLMLRYVDITWAVASVCHTTPRAKRAVQDILRADKLRDLEKEFLEGVFQERAWNAID